MNPYLMVSRAGTLRRFFLVLLLLGSLILVFGAAELPDRVELSRLQLGTGFGVLLLVSLLFHRDTRSRPGKALDDWLQET